MISVLFLIHDLGCGGAEKALVNLANNLDPERFDVTVTALFGGGVNEQFLAPHIKYDTICPKSFPGNSHIMKLLSPKKMHALCVKKHYDVEIAYLEGTAARVISGCTDPNSKLIGWIHVEQHTQKCAAQAFRSYGESKRCYERFDQIVCVSGTVRKDFLSIYPDIHNTQVFYNTIDTDQILSLKEELVEDNIFSENDPYTEFKLVAVGKIEKNKGIDRLARIVKRLCDDGIGVHLFVLGTGREKPVIEKYIEENNLTRNITFLGYQTNPYKYVARCDLFVCASLAEGFSTAASEALIVGTPVCTVEVSGMKEMLGDDNEWGVVTENTEYALYRGIKGLLTDPDQLNYYRSRAAERGKMFSKENTVKAVEEFLQEILN